MASALAAAGPAKVALAGYRQHQPAAEGPPIIVETLPSARLLPQASLASVNIVPDADGLTRAYPAGADLGGAWRPSLAHWAIGAVDRRADVRIDLTIDVAAIPYFGYVDVISGRADPVWLSGRSVLVGAIDPVLGDMVAIPRWRALPGVMVHALAAETLLQDRGLVSVAGDTLGPALALLVLLLGPRLERQPLARVVGAAASTFASSAALATALHLGCSRVLALAPIGIACGATALVATLGDRARLRAARQEAALEAERRRRLVESIVASSFDGILTVAADGRVQTVNPAASAMLGAPADELTGRRLAEIDPRLAGLLPGSAGPGGWRGEVELGRRGSRVRTLETTASRIVDPIAGAIDVLVLRDVSEARATAAALDRLLHHDGPSGLPSRAMLEGALGPLLDEAVRSGDRLALVVVALRGLSDLEEIQGSEVAAEILRSVAGRLGRRIEPTGPVARVGTGELAFAVRMPPITGPNARTAESGASETRARETGTPERGRSGAGLAAIGSAVTAAVAGASIGGTDVRVGAAFFPEHALTPGALLRCALLAARASPDQPGAVHVYAPAEDRRTRRRLELAARLRTTVRHGQLELVYQPKIDTWTGPPTGAEALVRWRDAVLGPVSPSEFVPLAEESDLIGPLTELVLARALADEASLRERGLDLPIAVNLSGRTLERAGAGGALLSLVERLGGSPARLSFEVTETALIRSGTQATDAVACLRDAGYAVALVDFGVGYSSFARLRDLPVSSVKIDRALVRVLPGDRSGAQVLASVLELAEKLGLETVGEGVEEAADLERLRVLGCTFARGFHIAPPMAAAELAAWLAAKLPRSRLAERPKEPADAFAEPEGAT